MLGRYEEALQMRRDVYSGRLKLNGEEHERPSSSHQLRVVPLSYDASKKPSDAAQTMPVARRVLGRARAHAQDEVDYAQALYRTRRHARRSPRGRDDARGRGPDRAARARGAHPTTGTDQGVCEVAAELARAAERGRSRDHDAFATRQILEGERPEVAA